MPEAHAVKFDTSVTYLIARKIFPQQAQRIDEIRRKRVAANECGAARDSPTESAHQGQAKSPGDENTAAEEAKDSEDHHV